jgi:hypothetical protein
VRDFAVRWRRQGLPLHVLINNAGVGATEVTVTEDNIETVFATNHVGMHLALLNWFLFVCFLFSLIGFCLVFFISSNRNGLTLKVTSC